MAWCGDRPISKPRKVKPMGNAYEIYALRYATMSPRTPHLNYLVPDPHETTAQDLDYFVWLIRGGGRDILVDTGFNAEEAAAAKSQAHAQSGRCAGALRRQGRRHQGHHRHPSALRPRRQSRSLSERAVSSAGSRDELRHRALHVQRHAAASVFGRACDADGAPCLWRARHLSFRRRRGRAGRDACIASAAIPTACRWCGSRPRAARWCWPRMRRITTAICIAAARFRSSTISATWRRAGKSSSGWPAIPTASFPGHDPIVSEIYPRASDKVDAFALHLKPSRSFVK